MWNTHGKNTINAYNDSGKKFENYNFFKLRDGESVIVELYRL